MKSTGSLFWLLTTTLLFGNLQALAAISGAKEGLRRCNPPDLTISPAKINHDLFNTWLYEMKTGMPSVGSDSTRADSRSLRTRGAVEGLLRRNPPRLTFNPSEITPETFPAWQTEMKSAMKRLMRHPQAQAAAPSLVKRVKRPGYTLEKWESYPLDSTVVPFLVLIPDGVDASRPAPAALCIPGFGQPKELLAGERLGNFSLDGPADTTAGVNAMALHYVRHGLVAVAVDNPSCGELSDDGRFDYLETSRFLLECGWSYLGLSSWQDRVILDWMKTVPMVDKSRIIVSGFSLGTETLMALGLLDDSIFAFVYNDFLCRTRERALVMNRPDASGVRAFPNSIEHLIPGFLLEFDFPDIVAALAPRPVICTEGGMDRDFEIVARAFAAAGAPDNFTWHHYPAFADPAARVPLQAMPKGIDRATFFRLANVDPPSHYFKSALILPWLDRLLTGRPAEPRKMAENE